jgi:lysophospholipase
MRITDVVLILAVLQSCVVQAAVLKHHSSTSKKINIDSSYAPTSTACPTGPLVRTSTAINPDESEYIQKHQKSNQLAWVNWLSSSKGPNLDAEGGFQGDLASYLSDVNNLPKVAIAMSGGGLRAQVSKLSTMSFYSILKCLHSEQKLNGIGYLQGLDSRNSTAVSRGTGGFLQLVSYVAGLSGGGWGVGSLAINDWPTPQSLLDNTYNLSDGLASIGNTTSEDTSYLTQIGNDLTAKQSAGYQVSLIDLWGRLLSTQYVNPITSNNTAGLQWSDIQQTQAFTSAAYPFPIVTAAQDIAGQNAGGGKGTLWEFNPLETGSWDQGIAAFTPTRIFGSTLLNGASTSCITGYDNL